MQGRHVFQPQAETVINLESFVAQEHFLRKVHRILDLSFVQELTAPCYVEGLGRLSIDAEVFFRLLLVAHIYGIKSDRRLCDDVHHNLAYRWFCRLSLEDEVPDHSSLSRIRDRYGEEVFEAVFRQIVMLCKKKDLVHQECCVMTDATLIAADASLNSLVHNDSQQAEKEAEAQQRGRGMIDSSATRKVSNQTHTSRTDPDATLARKKGSSRQLKYKVHQSIDADSRVILDTYVTTGARHDNQPYLDQLQRIRDRYKLTIREATADRGYGSAAIIEALQGEGTKTYIPLWNTRTGGNSGSAVGLVYEREEDRIRCPADKYLYPSSGNYDNRKRYASLSGGCRECPHASTCPAKNRKKAPHTRFVLRPNDQDLFDEVQARMRDPTFRQKMSERMWKCEGLFARRSTDQRSRRSRIMACRERGIAAGPKYKSKPT